MALRHVIAVAQRTARRAAGVQVLYRRGELETELTAIPGRTMAEQNARGELGAPLIKSHVRDYLIETAELILGGEQTLPVDGDQIVEVCDGESAVYEAMPVGQEPCWRYSDPYKNQVRIHTRQVG